MKPRKPSSTRPPRPRRQLDSAPRPQELPGLRNHRPRTPVDIHPTVAARMRRYRAHHDQLRWRCDPRAFGFRSTRELAPDLSSSAAFFGQRKALKSIRMALAMDSPGYNLFLCGLSGTRKLTLVEEYIRSAYQNRHEVSDRCYVQNFEDPRRPKLIELPPGQGSKLQADVAQLLSRLQSGLDKLNEKRWRSRAAAILAEHLPRLEAAHPQDDVRRWLGSWKRSLLRNIRTLAVEDYEVNFLGRHGGRRRSNVIVDKNPTHANLFGWIGRRTMADQTTMPHFTEISRGAYLEADGGVLILDANDIYGAPGVWTTLKSCLKYGALEIQDGDPSAPARTAVIKPEPIMTRVKVVLLGDYDLYEYLFDIDPDFAEVFKIRVDFEPDMDLNQEVLRRVFPRFVTGICAQERLRPVSAGGLARLVEYCVRRAGRKRKITAESWVVEDVLREADYWAGAARRRTIGAKEVDQSISEAINRVNLLEKKIEEMILDGTILISTTGACVGQVNGLAIYDMGDYSFGKPSRITAETSVGEGGIINIERESGLSGKSHDKGVQILAGYLRSCFAQNRPLSLTASVCFEQSYSGIDGDSASATEIFALLSSLSGLPIRQDIAVTGSVSQKGDVQPIGGVNEKIEGYYDCIQAGRPTGTEGVLIPRKNLGDLMLREDVVAAIQRGTFHLFAIDTVSEGIEVLTGVPAGRRRKDGRYPSKTVFDRVDRRLEELASDLKRYDAT
jgi:predicted ATP-dependent protease